VSVIYTDWGQSYPDLNQPQSAFVIHAEEERAGEQVTWPEIHARAWELQMEYENSWEYAD